MDRLTDNAWRAEEELLAPHVRSDSSRLRALLSPDFYEIGQSGTRWSREDVISALVRKTAVFPAVTLSERDSRVVTSDTVLLSYRLQFGERQSLRSSVWQRNRSSVWCIFHQGTPVVLP